MEEIRDLSIKKIIYSAVILTIAIILFFGSFFVVPAGYRAVVFNTFSGVKETNYGFAKNEKK